MWPLMLVLLLTCLWLSIAGLNPLHLAVIHGQDSMLKQLLAYGAKPDVQVVWPKDILLSKWCPSPFRGLIMLRIFSLPTDRVIMLRRWLQAKLQCSWLWRGNCFWWQNLYFLFAVLPNKSFSGVVKKQSRCCFATAQTSVFPTLVGSLQSHCAQKIGRTKGFSQYYAWFLNFSCVTRSGKGLKSETIQNQNKTIAGVW